MKIFTCDICGTDDLIRQDDYFVCQSCGTKYAVEEVRKAISDLLDIKFPQIPKVVEQGIEHIYATDTTAINITFTRNRAIFVEVQQAVHALNQQGKRVVQIIYDGSGVGAHISSAWILWERWE